MSPYLLGRIKSVSRVTVRSDSNHDREFALFARVNTELASPFAQECPGGITDEGWVTGLTADCDVHHCTVLNQMRP